MAKSSEDIAAEITAAWIQGVAQVATAAHGTAAGTMMNGKLSSESVAGFYKQIHKQVVDSFNGR